MGTHSTSRHSRLTIALALGFLLVAGALLIVNQQNEPEVLAGQTSVIDGDTLRVAGQKVRLQGLAAPELDEPGGIEAKNAMVQLVERQQASCELDGTTSYDRVVGICYVGGRDVAELLVTRGVARDCPRFSNGRYREHETPEARSLPCRATVPLEEMCSLRSAARHWSGVAASKEHGLRD